MRTASIQLLEERHLARVEGARKHHVIRMLPVMHCAIDPDTNGFRLEWRSD